MAKNATCSTFFGVIAPNLACRLVNSVEFDSKVSNVELLPWVFPKRKKESQESNSTLLTSLWTKFEAITPKDVEQVAFLAKAVCHERFQIKEAITFDLSHLWE